MRKELNVENNIQYFSEAIDLEFENKFQNASEAVVESTAASQKTPTGYIYQELYSSAQCRGNLTYSNGFAAGVCLTLYDEVSGQAVGTLYSFYFFRFHLIFHHDR